MVSVAPPGHSDSSLVEAVKITGSTTKEENKRITSNLHNMASGKSQNVRPIRLCYVTVCEFPPEDIRPLTL